VRREGARPESAVRLSWGRAIAKARTAATIIVNGEVRFGDGEIERLRPDFRVIIEATRANFAALFAAHGKARAPSTRIDAFRAHDLRNMLGGGPPAGVESPPLPFPSC